MVALIPVYVSYVTCKHVSTSVGVVVEGSTRCGLTPFKGASLLAQVEKTGDLYSHTLKV